MDLPDQNATYKLQQYWDVRYTKEENYEWFKSYVDFKELMHEHARTTDRILMLGCGNSKLSEDMYNDGYKNIVNIDFSPVVIENMKRKCLEMAGMEWHVMDITNIAFSPRSFDVVVEKATLDALLVAEKDLWNPSDQSCKTMDRVLSQVSEILRKRGRFISVTFSQPHFRKPFLAKSHYNWSISVNTLGESFHYFFYVMHKGKQLDEGDKELETAVINRRNLRNNKPDEERLSCQLVEDTEDFLFNIVL